MSVIQNPILSDFPPDAGICRVSDDCFFANSPSEWFPSVPVHPTLHRMHWRLIGNEPV